MADHGLPIFGKEELLPYARNRRELQDFKRFDKTLEDIQIAAKGTLNELVNLAARIACQFHSSTGMRFVIERLNIISKEAGAKRETAFYVADSIMRHAEAYDVHLFGRYEKHIGPHLRNFVKRL